GRHPADGHLPGHPVLDRPSPRPPHHGGLHAPNRPAGRPGAPDDPADRSADARVPAPPALSLGRRDSDERRERLLLLPRHRDCGLDAWSLASATRVALLPRLVLRCPDVWDRAPRDPPRAGAPLPSR